MIFSTQQLHFLILCTFSGFGDWGFGEMRLGELGFGNLGFAKCEDTCQPMDHGVSLAAC